MFRVRRAGGRRTKACGEVASVDPGGIDDLMLGCGPPGGAWPVVSTFMVLEGQLKTGPLPSADVLHAYGQYVVRLGAAVVSYAEECMGAPADQQARTFPAAGNLGTWPT